MSTRGTQLISRIVRTGEIERVINWGVTPEDFPLHEDRAMWNLLFGYYTNPATKGSVLGPEKAREVFPTLILCDDPNVSTEALCHDTRLERIRIDNDAVVKQILQLNQHDPIAAAQLMARGGEIGTLLATQRSTDVSFTHATDAVLHRYGLMKQGYDTSVCPWPWQPMQDATGGMQPDDYVIFYGRPKSKKSWVLAAVIAHMYRLGKPVLIYTKEMTAENIFQRVLAVLAMVPYQQFRQGKLDQQFEENVWQVKQHIDYMSKHQHFICLNGADAAGANADTVPWLAAKSKQYKPSVVFVDGIYLLSDTQKTNKDNERVRNISRALRRIPLDQGTPLIGTVQATRGAAQHSRGELDEIAFSDAISQDCTLAMRTINDKRLMQDAEDTITLKVAGARETDLEGFRIFGVPATNFTFKEVLSMAEILEAEQGDSNVKQKKQAKRREQDGAVLVDALSRVQAMGISR